MVYLVTTQLLPDSSVFKIISAQEALTMLESLKEVGLDTETEGFDPYTKKLLMVQLGCFDFQIVIDCTTIDIRIFKEYLESDREFLGWNIKFDLKFLLHYGIVIKNVYDGFIAEKLLYLGYPFGFHSMSLKSAGETYCNIELDKSVRGRIIWEGLSNSTVLYGANDVKYLPDIKKKQVVLLIENGLFTANEYERRCVPWMAYTEYCGVRLNEVRWKKKMELDDFTKSVFLKGLNDWVIAAATGEHYIYYYLQTEGVKDLDKVRSKMKGERCSEKDIKGSIRGYAEAYKVPLNQRVSSKFIECSNQLNLFTGDVPQAECLINWDSSKQVIPLLKSLGFQLRVKDKDTGEYKDSVESKVIEPQANLSTISYLYLEYKAMSKVTSTYGQNVLNQINPVSKRIHTNFNQIGTDTDRLSSGGTDKSNNIKYLNFQNFPNDEETRACFISAPGMKWISCDYSGQESRIIADLTDDKTMLDLFINGCGDVHSLVAKMSFPDIIGDTPIEKIKKLYHGARNDAKDVEFAINYGGDANTIHQNSGKSEVDSQKIYDNYMKGFPGIAEYQKRQRKSVMELGYILLNPLSGHKAYIYDYDTLIGCKRRFTTEFWELYRTYKDCQNPFLPKNVKAEICKRFADGLPIEEITGSYIYTVKSGSKVKQEEVLVTEADAYIYPVKYYFRRKAESEKQSINYPCQGGVCALDKSHKFGEGCDANTEPSLIVILRRCND